MIGFQYISQHAAGNEKISYACLHTQLSRGYRLSNPAYTQIHLAYIRFCFYLTTKSCVVGTVCAVGMVRAVGTVFR